MQLTFGLPDVSQNVRPGSLVRAGDGGVGVDGQVGPPAVDHEGGHRTALLFADLDSFKDVNDTLGHAVGDRLLEEAARRFQSAVRRDDLVARLGGDEFIVLLRQVEEPEIRAVAQRILAAFSPPIEVDDRALPITPSVGIAVFPDDGADAETLLKHADVAMYQAKAEVRNRWSFYRPEP
jgi:diguanylate cyclase (GGDEF)-like protein